MRSACRRFAAMASTRSVLWLALCVAAVTVCQGRGLPISDAEVAMVTDPEPLVSAGRFSDILGNSLDVALFIGFVARYKEYKTVAEPKHQFATFVESVRLVERHNRERHSYTLGVNEFADMTNE